MRELISMARIFNLLILIAIIVISTFSILIYFKRLPFPEFVRPFVEDYRAFLYEPYPCSKPITYDIDRLDNDFDLSLKEFKMTIEEASAVWERPTGRDLFQFSEDGKLTINLIYDYRQSATNELQSIDSQISVNIASYDGLKNRYDSLVKSYNQQKASIKSNADVTRVNQLVDEINSTAKQLNSLAKETNSAVNTYNEIGNTLGGRFDEGRYVRDSSGERISIYQYENHDKLVRVLAHELGHVLGIEHLSDPDSIMYELNSGDIVGVSAYDLKALNVVCESI